MKEKITDRLIASLKTTGKRYDIRDSVVPGFMVRVGVSGQKAYYLDYRDSEGRRSKYRIGLVDSMLLTDAREEARRKAGEVAAGQNLNAVKKEKRQKAKSEKSEKLGVFIGTIYKPWRMAERKRAQEDLDRLELHFKSWYSMPMSEITERKVIEWRQKRLVAGISAKTVNRDIAALRAVFSHAVTVGVLKETPLKKFKPLKVDMRTKVRFLSKEEDERLMQLMEEREADQRQGRKSHNEFLRARNKPLKPDITDDMFSDHVYPLILIAIHTGCRPEELLNLDWKNVDLHHKTLTVEGYGAKSGQTRHVPLSKKAVAAFERWHRSPGAKKKGLVFPGKTGKPMGRMPRAITHAIERAKIEDFRPYDFRHTFASKLAMAGVDLNTIRELLGHEDISTTLIYAHLTHDHRKEAVSKVFDD
ncbi:phage integrase [Marinobacter adhaerens]|uniref:phage integrase n=1 Tax=Marinobacter adhaerens TaxID=1033846 RepID=UPI003D28A683